MVLLAAALGVAVVGMVGDGYAELEYLDVKLQLVDFGRVQSDDPIMRGHDIRVGDSDLLVYYVDITNNGVKRISTYDAILSLSVINEGDVEYYNDIGTDICVPSSQGLIHPRITETWLACFVVPSGLDPEFIHILTDSSSHIVQFDSSQTNQCVDFFKDWLCADYALDGKPPVKLQTEEPPVELVVYGVVVLAILIGLPIFVVWYLLRRRKLRNG